MPGFQEPDFFRLNNTRTAAVMGLRVGFKMHGYDVSDFADHQITGAIEAEAIAGTDPSRSLFTCAFERLTRHR